MTVNGYTEEALQKIADDDGIDAVYVQGFNDALKSQKVLGTPDVLDHVLEIIDNTYDQWVEWSTNDKEKLQGAKNILRRRVLALKGSESECQNIQAEKN